jgi:hypothetical protein
MTISADEWGRLLPLLFVAIFVLSIVALAFMIVLGLRLTDSLLRIANEVSVLNHRLTDITRSLISIEGSLENDEDKRDKYSTSSRRKTKPSL